MSGAGPALQMDASSLVARAHQRVKRDPIDATTMTVSLTAAGPVRDAVPARLSVTGERRSHPSVEGATARATTAARMVPVPAVGTGGSAPRSARCEMIVTCRPRREHGATIREHGGRG